MRLFKYMEDIGTMQQGDIVEVQKGIFVLTERQTLDENGKDRVEGIVLASKTDKENSINGLLDLIGQTKVKEEKEIYIVIIELLNSNK